jgi:hypothetical protein
MDLGFMCAPKFDLRATFSHPCTNGGSNGKGSPRQQTAYRPQSAFAGRNFILAQIGTGSRISGSYSVERNDVDMRVKERSFGLPSSLPEAARSRNDSVLRF